MDKTSLVVLKGTQSLEKNGYEIKAYKHYRHNIEGTNHMVYGEWFNEHEFNVNFEFYHDKVMRDFKELGLVNSDGTPISKAKFAKLADIHQYGNGRKALKIWYFRNSRERIYGFYPMQGTKAENTNECYKYFTDIVAGNVEPFDDGDVCFGNSGIPLAYGLLRVS